MKHKRAAELLRKDKLSGRDILEAKTKTEKRVRNLEKLKRSGNWSNRKETLLDYAKSRLKRIVE